MTPATSGSRRRVRRPARPAAVGHNTEDARDAPAQDWTEITIGSSVEVIPTAGTSYVGTVDAKTPDSDIVWVVSLGTGRRMHGNREGVRLRPAQGREA